MVLCVLMICPVGTKDISLNDIAAFQTSEIHFQRENGNSGVILESQLRNWQDSVVVDWIAPSIFYVSA